MAPRLQVCIYRKLSRFLLVSVLLAALTSCGGTDDSGNGGSVGVISPEVDQIFVAPTPTPTPSGPSVPTQTELTVLHFPDDFPAVIDKIFLGGAVQVTGLQPLQSYTFTTDTGNTLSAQNLGPESNSIVCFEGDQCTGTAVSSTVAVIVIGASIDGQLSGADKFAIDIKSSTAPAVYYEGTVSEPVPIEPGTHIGRVGSTRNDDDNSYYRLQSLVVGSRYSIAITPHDSEPLDSDLLVTGSDDSALCDPANSGGNSCQFVATETSVPMIVSGPFAIFGELFDIELTELSLESEFEGSWLQPVAVPLISPTMAQHTGYVDEFLSYYDITGLTPGSRYTILLHSRTSHTTMSTVNLETGSLQGGVCEFNQPWDNTGDQCTFMAQGSIQRIAVKGSASVPVSQYILSVRREAPSDGSKASPVNVPFSQVVYGNVAVTPGYYRLTDLPVGESVVLAARVREGLWAGVSLEHGDQNIPCNGGLCEFEVLKETASLTVTPNPDMIQSTPLLLSVFSVPVNETVSLDASELPAVVQSRNYYSRYTVTGLPANQFYRIEVSSLSNQAALSVVSNDRLQCDDAGVIRATAVCVAAADDHGALEVRLKGDDPGVNGVLNILPYEGVAAEYISTDTPVLIPENNMLGASSSINVIGSGMDAISDISVVVDVRHDYTNDVSMSLVTPDGREVLLMDHLYGGSLTSLSFDDYAEHKFDDRSERIGIALRPHSPLLVTNGISADGIWTLKVIDDQASNISSALGGEMFRWGISFNQALVP